MVTGASSGIGAETTRVLSLHGVHVIMGVKNMFAAKDVKETILKEIPSAKVDAMELDLCSMESVKKFASDFKSSGLPLNILVNNAGIMAYPFKLSTDKLNYRRKLHVKLIKKEGRIVNVSSQAHRFTYYEGICFDKINYESSLTKAIARLLLKNVQQGAATTCYVALHPQVKEISGKYFSASSVAKTTSQGTDADLAKKLRDFSMNLTK
ncbi:hypothetical protein GLYMA_20G161300v4 [Glycine max]|uniref:Uncharacterized protein n=1 Tax=Glycine max TaxID=3847 RepID=A0A0R0ED87_SOYBN|nr:hypothetical protein GLYMA_20G161300v4 [Glycine max]